jgi:hypothetical protein
VADEPIPVGLAKQIIVSGANIPIDGVLTPCAVVTFTLEPEDGEPASFAFAMRVNAATTVADWLTSIAKGLSAQTN